MTAMIETGRRPTPAPHFRSTVCCAASAQSATAAGAPELWHLRLIDRATGAPHHIDGTARLISPDPERMAATLLRNRDPHRWRVEATPATSIPKEA